jgi:carbonic anhydrase/acetyltransferase-like protein (isoleucine patch superfamily)
MPLVLPFGPAVPRLAASAWLAENVTVVGDVEVGEDSNIWYGCVLRGDVGTIRLGKRVNVQDVCCLHMTTGLSHTLLEDEVSIGHGVILHGAIVETGALVGMGCVIMDNARIGAESLVGAGSLVTADTVVPPRSLVLGRPAKVVRTLTDQEAARGRKTALHYVELAAAHARSVRGQAEAGGSAGR